MYEFSFYGLGNIIKPYNFTDKNKAIESYITYMLNRVQSMFKYEGLPDTIPQKMLELYIMINGHSVVVEHKDNLYVCFGGWGGEPNEYYIPTKYIVANPYLELFKTYTINEDCVLVHNDSMYYGLVPMFRRYATMLAENDITMSMVDVNSRITAIIEASDDKTRVSAEKFLDDIYAGKQGVVGSQAFFEGLHTQPYGEHNYQRLTDLIEYHQYMKASWFNELGLNANYNMKREAITSNESQLNDDQLLPLIDDMMKCRQEFIDRINHMYGTDITISYASSWEDNELELENAQQMEKITLGQESHSSFVDDINADDTRDTNNQDEPYETVSSDTDTDDDDSESTTVTIEINNDGGDINVSVLEDTSNNEDDVLSDDD